jgi:ketosteroid isomerase-like protein
MLTADDIIAIQQLLSLYGHAIDDREFDRAAEIFTPDVIYDTRAFDGQIHRGIEAVCANWHGYAHHPVGHHATNVIVTERDGQVHVVSKGIGVRADNTVRTTNYRDIVRRTPEGWRIAERVALPRSSNYRG